MPHGLFRGFQVLLGMEKAFDSVRRHTIYQALDVLQLPESLHGFAQSLLAPHKYYIPYKTLIGKLLATRGIRQGATDAPILWSLCMHLILKDLSGRYSHQ